MYGFSFFIQYIPKMFIFIFTHSDFFRFLLEIRLSLAPFRENRSSKRFILPETTLANCPNNHTLPKQNGN